MSGPVLRRKAHPARADPPEEDVENPGPRRSFAPGGRDPVAVAGAILRKVVAWLTSDDGDEEQSLPQNLVSILKDVAIGLVMGVLVIAVMVFLDGRGVIHLQSAHNMRTTAANQLLSDPATLASVEEAAEIKFLKPKTHILMKKALVGYAQLKVDIEAKAKETEAMENKSKELVDAGVPEEYERLASPLELGRYCDACEWNCDDCEWTFGRTCAERAEESAKADGTGRVAAKLKIMETEAALYEKKEAGATCSFPPGCRWDCYLENNAPMKKAWGDDEQKASQHFFRHGIKEGRNCKCEGG